MKKAMIVSVSISTRVVVDEDVRDTKIIEAAKENFHAVIRELDEYTADIEEDEEYPYNPETNGN